MGGSNGFPFRTTTSKHFMIALEEQTLSLLKNYIINWKRYVDDAYEYIKAEGFQRF